MRYSEVASEPAEEFFLDENDEVPLTSASRYLTPSGWNTTRVIHVMIIAVCVLSTSGAILFAIFNGGAGNETKAAILEVSTVPSTTVVRRANSSDPNGDVAVTPAISPASVEKNVNGTGSLNRTNEEYVEAKALALEESAVDVLPGQIPALRHLSSLMNEDKRVMLSFLGVGTGFFLLFGIFFSIVLYKRHLREARSIVLQASMRQINSTEDDLVAHHDSDDETDLFVANRATTSL